MWTVSSLSEEAGLYFTPDRGNSERYSFSANEQTALREILNKAGPARGNAVASTQMVWCEAYTYDKNGNRVTKTTPWGTIKYKYDAENRLVKKGDVVYTNDKDGNTLSEKGLRYEARYEYNAQNRMVYSQVTSHVEKTHTTNSYVYDAFGRRTIVQSVTGQALRTLYDGQSFEAIREGESFRDNSLTTRSAANGTMVNGTGTTSSNQATGERYRWVGEGSNGRVISEDGYTLTEGRFGARGVTLYGKGEAVAMGSSEGSRTMYLGKDVMGSVRSVTVDTGTLEIRYEHDAFGQPYKGDLGGWMNLGYTGKPYDTATGLYNYGYRDYKPQAARFTTVDPFRDGSNWFAYVNNDPINYTDPWGLKKRGVDINLYAESDYFYKVADKVYHPEYAFVVTGHGDYDHISNQSNGKDNKNRLYAADLADMIQENGWTPGQVIILDSCNVGKGADSFAQQLADELAKRTGETVIVLAPTNYLSVGPFGRVYIGPNNLSIIFKVSSFNFGRMEIFKGK